VTFLIKNESGDKRAFTLNSKGIIKIDHHIFSETFGGVELIDDKSASACDLVARILYSKFHKLPKIAASLLFLGLVTDTGRFLYTCNQKTLRIGARLLKDGADADNIYDSIFTYDEKAIKFRGFLMATYEKTFWGTTYLAIDAKTLEKFGYDKNTGSGFVNAIGSINASRIHVLFTEDKDGSVRVELRSRGDIDVQKIACKFNGGGHLNASGCVLSSLKDYPEVIRECDKAVVASFGKYAPELDAMVDLAKKSSALIMNYYKSGFKVETKSDNSPVTDADKASDKLIRDTLLNKFPNIGMLTEEDSDDKKRLMKHDVFVIDPLDGTMDYVAKDNMFAVNMALVHDHIPVVGVVAIPYESTIYFAVKGYGAYVVKPGEMIKVLRVSDRKKNLIILNSVFHKTPEILALMKEYPDKIKDIQYIGSALKACLIAEGKGDICYSMGCGTKEWDTCAPQLIVEEAGGIYKSNNGEEIVYNRDDVYNRDGFMILNRFDNDILNQRKQKQYEKK
jgi:3'(2'), 5'-bisphosphate nucleotidase